MPKLLRILPIAALALLALVPAASTAPGPTTPYNGGFFDLSGAFSSWHSPNYEWVSSTRAPAWWDANRTNGRYVSDATFKGDTYFLASYDHFGAYDISDPANPEFLSSTNCPGSQGDLIIQGNLLIKAHEGAHNIPYADLSRACETAAANETQRVYLYGYSTDGDSFTLNYNGADSAPIVRGTNNTTAGVAAALQGASEVQTVALTSYDENGDSYTLTYGGVDTYAITRGQNNTTAGIAAALQGGNEQQQVTLTNFNGATQSFQIRLNGNDSVVLGLGGLAINNGNVATAVNGIAGFAGTVTSAGAGNGGFTLTFGGASANTDVNSVEIVNCTGACTSTVRENVKGGAAIASWPANGTVSVGSLTDAGYTLTFGTAATGGPGHQGTDVSDVTVTNGAGTTPPSGIVTETTKGTAGILPVGSAVTVASIGGIAVAPAFADAGFNVTFSGGLAGTNVSELSLTNLNGLNDDPESDDPNFGARSVSHVLQTVVAAPPASFSGITIFDVSDPSDPVFLKAVPVCGGGHTITKYFDKDHNRLIVYMTRGTTTGSLAAWGINCAGLPGGRLTAVAIPMAHPKNAYVASENVLTGFAGNGCHDVNVHEEARLITMACPNGPGLSMARLADDGLSAQLMWTFTWPGLATTHSAAISWDGKLAFVNGEPGGGSGAECAFDDDVVKPTMHILDAQTGRLLGNWALPRPQGTQGTENCTIHVLNMIPMVGKHLMATSFYNGGMAVTDFTNPRAPRELAFMDIPSAPPGTPTNDQSEGCWTGYWYNNYQYCTELSWGFHVWRMNDGAWDNTLTVDHLNGQTHDSFIKCKVSFTGGPSKAGKAGTVNATVQLFGAGPLQPGKGVKVRVSAPGFNKVLTTNTSGTASTSVTASKAGQLNVTVPVQVNLPDDCSAPSKAIAKKKKARR